jgi:hypothetical protein
MRNFIRNWLGVDDARAVAAEAAVKDVQAALQTLQTAIPPTYDDHELRVALDTLEDRMSSLREAVAEGIERVDRSERRISQVVRRAKERYEGDPGVEAEYAALDHGQQLQLGHGEGSGGGGVQPMHQALEGRRLDLSAVPGEISDEDIAALMSRHGH